jgi:peptide-methionine (S)-S-oxide reductase
MWALNKASIVFVSAMILTIFSACEQINTQKPDTHGIVKAGSHPVNANIGTATFAGGCFWCTEADFDKVPGVLSTTSGYIGGSKVDANYERVSSGKTGHVEAVEVLFDSTKTNYAKLLAAYWQTIDPLTSNGQFCDRGLQYRSAIFYTDLDQKKLAEESKGELAASGRFSKPIMTEIWPSTTFYPAEEYHQDYYIKNPIRYAYYRSSCGRDGRLEEVWGKN